MRVPRTASGLALSPDAARALDAHRHRSGRLGLLLARYGQPGDAYRVLDEHGEELFGPPRRD